MVKVFQTILDRYVAEIDPEKLSDAAIEGMLKELDPYSQHIDQNNSHRLDVITTGEYGGVGIRLGRMDDTLIVITPMDGTPAFLQGIQAGDRIIKIDTVWSKDLSISEAADMVRGETGTILNLLIARPGESEKLLFELERELIKVPDVSYSGLLPDRLGYVKLANFSKYSAEDLEKAIRKLERTGLNGLILDLRGNPGGLLSAALQSADLFIQEESLLLETKGRIKQANKQYHARRRPIVRDDLPMAVLIDGGSASASEILSGILQDYDRAVLVGTPSFGKGLVQTVTPLDQDSRLKLTTAKYYLPSGRLIQKRAIADAVLFEDPLKAQDESFHSQASREFEAGAGVSPDIMVEDWPISDIERDLWRTRSFFKYALRYEHSHAGTRLPARLSESEVDSFYVWLENNGLLPSSRLSRIFEDAWSHIDTSISSFERWERLHAEMNQLDAEYIQDMYRKNRIQILSGLEMELAQILGGNGARIAASLNHDPVIDEASRILLSQSEFEAIIAGSGSSDDTK